MANTIRGFVMRHGIGFGAEWADSNPHMSHLSDHWRDAHHFKVQIRKGRRKLTTYFSQGYGISGEPTVEDVLDCLACDAMMVEGGRSFEDWCGELGLDTDSRKAEKTFKLVELQAKELRCVLGDEAYDELLYETERL
jgi:hypothetical protein